MIVDRLLFVTAAAAVIAFAGIAARGAARSQAARESAVALPLAGEEAEALLAPHAADPADARWLHERLVLEARARRAARGPALALTDVVAARITAADLPPPDQAPLARLRRKAAAPTAPAAALSAAHGAATVAVPTVPAELAAHATATVPAELAVPANPTVPTIPAGHAAPTDVTTPATAPEATSSGAVLLLDASARAEMLDDLRSAHVATRTREEFLRSFDRALAVWGASLLALAAMLAGRMRADSRSRWLALLAVGGLAAITALGMVVLASAEGPLSGPLVAEAAASHLAIGVAAGLAAVLLLPVLAERLGARTVLRDALEDGRAALAAGVLLFVVLAIFGTGPAGSSARINLDTPLGTFQPLELVKLLFVVGCAQHVGRFDASFGILARRQGWTGPWRLVLLAPFAATLLALVASAWLLGDFGTVLVLAPTVALIVVASSGSALAALCLVAAAAAGIPLLVALPWPAGSKVFVRLMTWLVPEANGLPGGDQLALADRAVAAGGWLGSSWPVHPGAVPAGTTDLPAALLVERFGVLGLLVLVVATLALVFAGVAIGARLDGRRGEIRYVPMGLAFLFAVQACVSLAGTAGLLPLSGIVVPLISDGGTGMLAFGGAAVAIAWCGMIRGGPQRAPAADRLPRGLAVGFTGVLAAVAAAFVVLGARAVGSPSRLAEPIVTPLADGRIAARWGALMRNAIRGIAPPAILDRNGRVIAQGQRTYPYGAALAPVTGLARGGLTPLPGTLEAELREHFSRFPARPSSAMVVEGCERPCKGAWSAIGVVPEGGPFRAMLLAGVKRRHPNADVRLTPYEAPDFASLAPALREGPVAVADKLESIRTIAPDVRATLDAEVQKGAHELLVEAIGAAKASFGAVVVREVATGQVLVHASAPSAEPEAIDHAAYASAAITGPRGALRDHGTRSAVPPGSTFKPLTALALLAAEREKRFEPEPCVHHYRPGKLGMQGNLRFSAGDSSGWIADFKKERAHGKLDLETALEVSCNVFFAQAGIAAGGERMHALVDALRTSSFPASAAAGVDLGAAAVGQGTNLMTPDQVSLAYAAIAGGGAARDCPILPSEPCREVQLTAHAEDLQPIVRALRRVVTSPHGTGGRAREPKNASFTVYGKTGTAEQALVRGETGDADDHAWFAGFFEGADGRRYAFAILLGRAGLGGKAAAPLAPKLGALLADHGYFDAVAAR